MASHLATGTILVLFLILAVLWHDLLFCFSFSKLDHVVNEVCLYNEHDYLRSMVVLEKVIFANTRQLKSEILYDE